MCVGGGGGEAELKSSLLEGDEKVLNKLLYFAASIPATRHDLKYKTHQAVSFTPWLRLSSDDKAMCFAATPKLQRTVWVCWWCGFGSHDHPACLFTSLLLLLLLFLVTTC